MLLEDTDAAAEKQPDCEGKGDSEDENIEDSDGLPVLLAERTLVADALAEALPVTDGEELAELLVDDDSVAVVVSVAPEVGLLEDVFKDVAVPLHDAEGVKLANAVAELQPVGVIVAEEEDVLDVEPLPVALRVPEPLIELLPVEDNVLAAVDVPVVDLVAKDDPVKTAELVETALLERLSMAVVV